MMCNIDDRLLIYQETLLKTSSVSTSLFNCMMHIYQCKNWTRTHRLPCTYHHEAFVPNSCPIVMNHETCIRMTSKQPTLLIYNHQFHLQAVFFIKARANISLYSMACCYGFVFFLTKWLFLRF